MKKFNRRDLLKSTSVGAVGAVSASMIGKAGAAEDPNREVLARDGFGPALPDERGFSYLGEPLKKTPQKNYFTYQSERANRVDYGLSNAQEAHASDLHSTLHIFDGEFEVSYYDGLIENMMATGAAATGGSYTIDALCFELFNGVENREDFEVKPSDWWTRECMDRDILFVQTLIEKYQGKLKLCTNYADLMEAKENGQISIMLDAQNTRFLRGDLSTLEFYYDKGVRRVQLSYNRQEMAATGCMEPVDSGVALFGQEVIAKMNEMNMLVDVGHCSSQTMLDAIDISEAPIICSHAGLRSIAPSNPRTHTDDGLKKLGDNGGVFGVVGVPGTLVDGSDTASVKDFVNAIDKAVNIMGIDHVGFALDQVQGPSMGEYLTAPEWPPSAVESVSVTNWPWSDTFHGMENHTGYINLTRGLVWKGYSDDDIRKIMGGNMMRLIKEVIG